MILPKYVKFSTNGWMILPIEKPQFTCPVCLEIITLKSVDSNYYISELYDEDEICKHPKFVYDGKVYISCCATPALCIKMSGKNSHCDGCKGEIYYAMMELELSKFNKKEIRKVIKILKEYKTLSRWNSHSPLYYNHSIPLFFEILPILMEKEFHLLDCKHSHSLSTTHLKKLLNNAIMIEIEKLLKT